MGFADVHAHLTHPRLRADVDGVLAARARCGRDDDHLNGLNPRDNAAVRELARRATRWSDRRSASTRSTPCCARCARSAPSTRARATVHGGGRHRLGARRTSARPSPSARSDSTATGCRRRCGHGRRRCFAQLVALALDADKPIIVHTRKRERRAFEILQRARRDARRLALLRRQGEAGARRSPSTGTASRFPPTRAAPRASRACSRRCRAIACCSRPTVRTCARTAPAAASRRTSPARRSMPERCGRLDRRGGRPHRQNFARLFGFAPEDRWLVDVREVEPGPLRAYARPMPQNVPAFEFSDDAKRVRQVIYEHWCAPRPRPQPPRGPRSNRPRARAPGRGVPRAGSGTDPDPRPAHQPAGDSQVPALLELPEPGGGVSRRPLPLLRRLRHGIDRHLAHAAVRGQGAAARVVLRLLPRAGVARRSRRRGAAGERTGAADSRQHHAARVERRRHRLHVRQHELRSRRRPCAGVRAPDRAPRRPLHDRAGAAVRRRHRREPDAPLRLGAGGAGPVAGDRGHASTCTR